MATNVWLRQLWYDYKLKWNPVDYGGVSYLHVPSVELWLPDIVLYNNADGNYEIVLMTKAKVNYDGLIDWTPPAIYKSSCAIDIEHFPFDTQVCSMKFGSWTYGLSELDLQHIIHYGHNDVTEPHDTPFEVNTKMFTESVEWDLLSAYGNRTVVKYPCCPALYVDITFRITLRRKVLFYLVNLICPCVSISFLTVLVFFLPADSGEKVALCINILLSLTVFFLLLAEIIPPTSLVIPLIGKYLLLTIGLLTLSIMVTVINLNLHYRSSVSNRKMPDWMRRVFLDILPQLLVLQKPNFDYQTRKSEHNANHSPVQSEGRPLQACTCTCERKGRAVKSTMCSEGLHCAQLQVDESDGELRELHMRLFRALSGLRLVAASTHEQDDHQINTQEWNYAAMVIDRLCLYVFTTACIFGAAGIILQAPSLYSGERAISGNSLSNSA